MNIKAIAMVITLFLLSNIFGAAGYLMAGISDFIAPGNWLSFADSEVYLPRRARTFRREPRNTVVAEAGDYDGDGRSEVLVAVDDISRIYLLRGSEINSDGEFEAIDSDGIVFATEDDYIAGHDCATLGDIDGDTVPELLIGASGLNEGYGGAYLILGSHIREMFDSERNRYDLDEHADYIFNGTGDDSNMGYTVSFTGDIDGDGKSEILIGGDGMASGGEIRPKVYIFYSENIIASDRHIELSAADHIFTGITGGFSSCRVAGAGDVDGDGYADVLIGNEAAAGHRAGMELAGRTYLITGSTFRRHRTVGMTPADAEYIFMGETANDSSGRYICGGGDIDGDDLSDIMIGAPNHGWPDMAEVGKTYLFSGATIETLEGPVVGLESADCVFIAPPLDGNPSSIAFLDDMNGDGYSEILTGHKGYFDWRGGALLYLSSAVREIIEAGRGEIRSYQAQCIFYGESPAFLTLRGEKAGECVAGSGDVNGDGKPDLIISSPGFPLGLEDSDYWDGKVSVILYDIPETIYVDCFSGRPAGPGTAEEPYDTIEGGLNAAELWGVREVIVRGGIYDEVVILRPGITVRGELRWDWLSPIISVGKPVYLVEGADGATLKYCVLLDGGIRLDGCGDMLLEENAVVVRTEGMDALRLIGRSSGNDIRNNIFIARSADLSSVVFLGLFSESNRFINNTIHGVRHNPFTLPAECGTGVAGVFLAMGADGNEFRNNIVEITTQPADMGCDIYGFYGELGLDAIVEYCKTPEGNLGVRPGDGNIIGGDGPGFIHPFPMGLDYRLKEESVCRDRGDPDLDGDWITWEDDEDDRDPDGTRMDMGAYSGPAPIDFRE